MLSPGAIAGIVIGSVLACSLVVAVVFYTYRRRRLSLAAVEYSAAPKPAPQVMLSGSMDGPVPVAGSAPSQINYNYPMAEAPDSHARYDPTAYAGIRPNYGMAHHGRQPLPTRGVVAVSIASRDSDE
ncbi:hypothetical protein QBC46DRAFT_412187 [Diplogelasinospora grovesii]|uniref:Uncharacterized protein n=1 Tax=Diplogelasinospora grovesii TaxID=303347 RepID=A0AAN6MZG2_9PEZI|nr:hypothetical protein QBC46DRAFT_412187 [Diplogelasinospora grovesii]